MAVKHLSNRNNNSSSKVNDTFASAVVTAVATVAATIEAAICLAMYWLSKRMGEMIENRVKAWAIAVKDCDELVGRRHPTKIDAED